MTKNYMSRDPHDGAAGEAKRDHGDAAERHLGAIEGDRANDSPQQGNTNAPALNDEGLPEDDVKICEDVLGANVDRSQG